MVATARPLRIAIIDDDKSAREAIEGLMRAVGYEASAFSSVDQFLAWNYRSEVACIITDLQMPGRSGLELADVLDAEGSAAHIIFVTGLPPEHRTRAAIEASARQLLPKPIDPEELVRGVEQALAAHGPR